MPDNRRTATSVRFFAPIAAILVAFTSLVGSALGGHGGETGPVILACNKVL